MAQPLKIVEYNNPKNLRLHVYVVGYPDEGESILTVVAEDDKPLLTIVTDCYENSQGYNHVSEILSKEWNSPFLDSFIWTHPHKDHSVGIMKLVTDFDKQKEGHIIAAINSVGYDNCPGIWSEASLIQKELLKRYPPKTFKYHFKGYDPYTDNKLEFLLKAANQQDPDLNLSLDFVAPDPAMVAQQMNNKTCKPNKGSLAFLLSINGVDIFMGGDLDKSCVTFIEDDVFHHVNLIKIPHHGSEHTGDIHLKFGMNSCDVVHAATTVFSKSRDPKTKILQGYRDIGATVHCTGPQPGTDPADQYGCMHYVYNIYTSRFESLFPTTNTYEYT